LTDSEAEVEIAQAPADTTVSTIGDDGEAPKRGTLAWLEAQPTVEYDGYAVPVCHRIPAGAKLASPDADSRCYVIGHDGERCRGRKLKALGLCMGHAGGGGTADLADMRRRSVERRAELKMTRQVLGIGASRRADPRAVMRLRAAQRANELARAIVDGPLDADLDAVVKQQAALRAVDATFPLQTASMTLSIDDPDDMSWNDMQQLAVSLLG